jgi:riboflavin biosynthesis pyrimidine reductase
VQLGLGATPLNVIVSAGGRLDLDLRVFQSGEVDVLILTTATGAGRISSRSVPGSVRVQVCPGDGSIRAADVLQATVASAGEGIVLVEGGPRLLGDFFGERLLDDLFLTVAPQVAGRDGRERPGLVSGRAFAPQDPLWGRLISTRRAESHLFLRYHFLRG